jgi:uncharacterized protein
VPDFPSTLCTAFDNDRLLAAGRLGEVALAVKRATESGAKGPLLTFDDVTGAVIDLDLRGTKADVLKRLSDRSTPSSSEDSDTSPAEAKGGEATARGRGRPKLGVVAREVTLLPRHWEWLASQPGGASVVLRRLVEEARRADTGQNQTRARREAAYRFMSAMAGNLAGFEEAARALFAGRKDDFEQHMAPWPEDVRTYALKLAATQTPEHEADRQ